MKLQLIQKNLKPPQSSSYPKLKTYFKASTIKTINNEAKKTS